MTSTVGYYVHNVENVALSLRNSLENGYVHCFHPEHVSLYLFSYDYIVASLNFSSIKLVPFSDVFLKGSGLVYCIDLYIEF